MTFKNISIIQLILQPKYLGSSGKFKSYSCTNILRLNDVVSEIDKNNQTKGNSMDICYQDKDLKPSRMNDWLITVTITCLLLILSFNVIAETQRVSVDSTGIEGNGYNYDPSISGDGRYVSFHSDANNLVAGDSNGKRDIFVHDRQTGLTERISVSSAGVEGNDRSDSPSISVNGQYVAFTSRASNLVEGDENGVSDVFIHDRQTGSTERVSINSDGDEGDDRSGSVDISADGRYVAFSSIASNLVAGDENGVSDVFIHDQQTGNTERVSINSDGGEGDGWSGFDGDISADGRYVAFLSYADNLVTGDHNNEADVFVHDRQTGETERVSVDSSGAEAIRPAGIFNVLTSFISISGDGRYVGFESQASNLVANDDNGVRDIFVHDRLTGETKKASVHSSGVEGNGGSYSTSSFSSDGRYVSFSSVATNLVTGETGGTPASLANVFVFDQQTGEIEKISISSSGANGNASSASPSISADGLHIAFNSRSSNFVSSDFNGTSDVFVHSRGNIKPIISSLSSFSVSENAITVTTVTAIDPNGDELIFSISGGVDQALFTINSTGQLSFLESPDFETPIDANDDNIYEVEVTVDDGHFSKDSQEIQITVSNLNEIPQISAPDSVTISENSLAVTNISGTDPDGDILEFSLSGGDDQLKFTITPAGQLSFKIAPDFDSKNDFNADNIYEIEVTVDDDNGGTDSKIILITVSNINEKPVILSSASISTPENEKDVLIITAVDPEGDTLTYSLTGGSDESSFNIDPSGQLSFVEAPNFEAPGDTNLDNIYEVEVTIDDGHGLTDTQTILVTVVGNNESPKIVSSATNSVAENTLAVHTVVATDAENDELTYTLTGGSDHSKFTINSLGQLHFVVITDYENPVDANNDNIYVVEVTVDDGHGLTDTQTISVTVTGVNESPQIVSSTTNSVLENTLAAHTVVATDAENDVLIYTIVGGSDHSKFTINSLGQLRFVVPMDYENPIDSNHDNIYLVEISVRDSQGGVSFQALSVTVTDDNESPVLPAFSLVTIPENTKAITTVTATDPENDRITFSLAGGVDNSLFTINSTGGISFISAPDFEIPTDSDSNNIYEVEIIAFDSRGKSVSRSLKVMINDVEEISRTSSPDEPDNDEETPETSSPVEPGNSGGGSFGWLSLLVLFSCYRYRLVR